MTYCQSIIIDDSLAGLIVKFFAANMIAFLGTGENSVGNTEKKVRRGRKALLTSVKEFRRLCSCYFKVQYGSQARHIRTEKLFQPSKQKDSVLSSPICAKM